MADACCRLSERDRMKQGPLRGIHTSHKTRGEGAPDPRHLTRDTTHIVVVGLRACTYDSSDLPIRLLKTSDLLEHQNNISLM